MADLEDLPYDELRDRTFALAEHRHDLAFFLELLNHTNSLQAASTEGGSLGDIGGSISALVTAAREVFGADGVGEMQPLFVARFATYLRNHEK